MTGSGSPILAGRGCQPLPEALKARRRRRKFWGRNTRLPKKSTFRTPERAVGDAASSRTRKRPILGRGCCLVLVLLARLVRLLMPVCQWPCCRAFGSHDGSVAARELIRCALQGARRMSRRLARHERRVSAAFRRGAAAYGNGCEHISGHSHPISQCILSASSDLRAAFYITF